MPCCLIFYDASWAINVWVPCFTPHANVLCPSHWPLVAMQPHPYSLHKYPNLITRCLSLHLIHHYIHSNRHPCPNRCPPPSSASSWHTKMGEIDDLLIKNTWINDKSPYDKSPHLQLLLLHDVFEVKFWAYNLVPTTCLAHAQWASIWVNMVVGGWEIFMDILIAVCHILQ